MDITVAIASPAPDPTNVSPIRITVVFSAQVDDFALEDLTLGNATAQNRVVRQRARASDLFEVDILPAGQGLVTVDIAPLACSITVMAASAIEPMVRCWNRALTDTAGPNRSNMLSTWCRPT